jgi:signal transduction histidine kinase
MLKVVLRNLVSNAIKFTNNGGTININAEQTTLSVKITVSDNGVGIPSAELEKLFEISDVKSTKGTSNEKGTGLGLMLCKEFIERHNGDLIIKSEVGKGTECIIVLPRKGRN